MVQVQLDHVELARHGGFRLGPMSLVMPAGHRTALVGPSGCGKTTLLRLVAGLEGATGGRVLLDGRIATDGRRITVAPALRRIGFVFQDGALWPHLDAVGHLRFCDPRLSTAAAGKLLHRVGLGGMEHRRPRELSGGEQQRLCLARALVGDARLLLLDEPLHSVDVHLRAELSTLIREVATERDLSVVVVTHDRDEALAIADHLVVLRGGMVVETGRAELLLTAPRTAFTAAFLAGATCLPAPRDGNGCVITALGRLPAPPESGPLSLVILPGDLRIDPRGTVRGRVVQVRPSPMGTVATVALQGRTVSALAGRSDGPGDEVGLSLQGPPRLLPDAVETSAP